jgi:hypothetical protein
MNPIFIHAFLDELEKTAERKRHSPEESRNTHAPLASKWRKTDIATQALMGAGLIAVGGGALYKGRQLSKLRKTIESVGGGGKADPRIQREIDRQKEELAKKVAQFPTKKRKVRAAVDRILRKRPPESEAGNVIPFPRFRGGPGPHGGGTIKTSARNIPVKNAKSRPFKGAPARITKVNTNISQDGNIVSGSVKKLVKRNIAGQKDLMPRWA